MASRLGESGRELLLELKRGCQALDDTQSSSSSVPLPPYNDALVQACFDDIRLHVQHLQDQTSIIQQQQTQDKKPSMSVRPALLLQRTILYRQKRCLLAYHRHRMKVVEQACWSTTADAGGGEQQQQHNNDSVLSPLEQEYMTEYQDLLQDYGQSMYLDLRSLSMPPLAQDKVQVRVLQDDIFQDGPIVLESGASIQFVAGETHFLSYQDVEEYIQQGYLQLLHGEEERL